jgi:hypothetical protein
MRVGAVVTDLMLFSRIDSLVREAESTLVRVDTPHDLTADLDLVLVDWSARHPGWEEVLRRSSARVVLFGPHTDLAAHTAARASGLGPMWARSRLLAELPSLVAIISGGHLTAPDHP